MLTDDIRTRSTIGATSVLLACIGTSVAIASQPVSDSEFSPLSVMVRTGGVDSTIGAANVFIRSLEDLLGSASKEALGAHGVQRLCDFTLCQAGWDGPNSKPLDLTSVIAFSRFVDETNLRPKGLAVFMSALGNVVVNWLEASGDMVELEFSEEGIHYFIESTSNEGVMPHGDVGTSKLYNLLVEGRHLPPEDVRA